MYLKSLLKYSKDVFSLLPTSKTNDVKCRWVRLHCSQSEMSHQRCFSVSETCLYKVYPFFMTSYWSKSKKTVQNLRFWLVDIIFSKKIRFVCFCCHALYLSVLNMHVSAEPERFYTYHICKERWAGPPFMLLYCIPQV